MEKKEKFEKIEKNLTITYQGSQITMFSDDRADYVNLTEMAKAWKNRKSIINWIRNSQTTDFLNVWERKYNSEYDGAHLSTVQKLIKERTLSIKQWVELTNAIGIFTRVGEFAGTYAHKDIAIRFAGWLSPEFELYLIEEIQRLKEIEHKKNSFELLSHEQILGLIQLKEVFKYVVNQEAVENAHKDVFAAQSNSKNPFAEFQTWRNKMLDIAPTTIEARLKEYCKVHNIAITSKLLKKPRREKILFYDSYESVKHAVWDFLQMKGEVNAFNLATLVENIIRTESGEIHRKNEDTLFQEKQELGNFNDFDLKINNMKEVKTAREFLALKEAEKKQMLNLSDFNKKLQLAAKFNPNDTTVPKSHTRVKDAPPHSTIDDEVKLGKEPKKHTKPYDSEKEKPE
jgi:hypothetical protein